MKLRISHKIMLLAVGAAVATGCAITIISEFRSSHALTQLASQKLEAVTTSKRDALSAYLKTIEEDVSFISTNRTVQEAFTALNTAYSGIHGNAEEALQKLYIEENPNPTGKKEALDFAPDGSAYSAAHAKYHPWMRSFLQTRGYYDIFLINPQGDIVYTVFKEPDFATNILHGRWKDSDLKKVVTAALDAPDRTHFVDFAAYTPSNGAPAAFIAKALKDAQGSTIGVLAFQMPIGRINDIMRTTTGMGESGETYLVGTDLLMRSDSRFSKEPTILKQKIDTPSVAAAFKGKTGVAHIKDYRGVPVFSAYTPLEYLGTHFVVIGEVDKAEIMAPVYALCRELATIALVLVVIISLIGFAVSRKITGPLNVLLEQIGLLEKGDKSFDVHYQGRTDEVGDVARALESFRQSALAQDRMAEEARLEQLRKEQRQQKIDALVKAFDKVVSHAVATVASAATELYQTADDMTRTAKNAGTQSSHVTRASQQTAANVQSVAAAAEEMTVAAREITLQISKSIHAVHDTVEKVEAANQSSFALSRASESIGAMVSTIEGISRQINLLALNATIESARAGEAGKGFAVVASEVKTLAGQTGRATEEIQSQINSVQGVSTAVVEALGTIREAVARVNEYSTAISAAVEEQSSVNQEVTRNMSTASAGVEQITQGIGAVNESIEVTSQSTSQVLEAAKMLSEQSEHLNKEVQTFLQEIRAA